MESAKRSAASAGRFEGWFLVRQARYDTERVVGEEAVGRNAHVEEFFVNWIAKIFTHRWLKIAPGFIFAKGDEREVDGDNSLYMLVAYAVHASTVCANAKRWRDTIHR